MIILLKKDSVVFSKQLSKINDNNEKFLKVKNSLFERKQNEIEIISFHEFCHKFDFFKYFEIDKNGILYLETKTFKGKNPFPFYEKSKVDYVTELSVIMDKDTNFIGIINRKYITSVHELDYYSCVFR